MKTLARLIPGASGSRTKAGCLLLIGFAVIGFLTGGLETHEAIRTLIEGAVGFYMRDTLGSNA